MTRRPAHDPILWPLVAGLAILVIALAIRLTLLIRADWLSDFDESVIGIMALEIADGRRPVFFAGQPYLGAVEAYLVSGLFGVTEPGRQALKTVPLILSLLWVASTQILATRLFGAAAGVVAALAAALPPLYVMEACLKAGIGVTPTLLLGNLLLLAAVELAKTPDGGTVWRWAAGDGRSAMGDWRLSAWAGFLGGVAGLAFWWHWLIAYYLVAVGIYLILRRPDLVLNPRCWLAVPAFLLASLPLWEYNLDHDWATFRYLLGPNEAHSAGVGPRNVLEDWVFHRAPAVLGSTSPVPGWLAWAAVFAMAASLVAVVLGAVRSWTQLRPSQLEPLVFFLFALPAVYAYSGFGTAAFNPFQVDASGRYVIPLFAAVPLAFAFLHRRGGKAFTGGCLALLAVISVAGAVESPADRLFQSPYYTRAPASLEPVIGVLDEVEVAHVWTDVGLAHPLIFQSRRRIQAADYLDRQAGGFVRFPEAFRSVEEANRTAFLVAVLPGQEGPLESELQRLEIEYQKWEMLNLVLLVPERRVDPQEVALGLGYQY